MNKFKKIYNIILLIIIFLFSTFYFSYAIFLNVKEEKGKLNIVAGTLNYKLESNDLTNNQIIVEAGKLKEITINLISLNDISSMYQLYYMMDDETLDVSIGYSSDSVDAVSGEIETNETKTITLIIYNKSDDDVTIIFDVNGGLINQELVLASGNSLNQELDKYYTISYVGFENTDNYPEKIIKGETLNIDFPVNVNSLSILSDNVLLVDEYHYNFTNTVLNIDKVTGNLKITNNSSFETELVTEKLVTFVSNDEQKTTTNYGDFQAYNSGVCSGNDGMLEYDDSGALVLDSDNPIPTLNVADIDLNDAYSVYITVKADTNQAVGSLGGTLFAISEANKKYLSWVSFNQNYINIRSFYYGEAGTCSGPYEINMVGARSFDISEYSNKILNIQIVGVRAGNTYVYFNGELVDTFTSGSDNISYSSMSIGDLRAGRNLKFTGNIYDFGFYNRELTEEEVKHNFEYAKNKWGIDY